MQAYSNPERESSSCPMFRVRGRTQDGSTVWYTGKAGQSFVSQDKADSFEYHGHLAAQARAQTLNRMAEVHGIWFVGTSS